MTPKERWVEKMTEHCRRHVQLSDASLKKVYEWAEQKDSPLAWAYLDICAALGHLVEPQIDKLIDAADFPDTRPFYKRPAWNGVFKAREFAFIARDTLGRLILNNINRTEP